MASPATLVDCVLEFGSLVFSQATFAELEARIWKPKFDRYLSIERRNRVLCEAFSAGALWVDVPGTSIAAQAYSRDAVR
jgi:predicted nucleic acid-binding protein